MITPPAPLTAGSRQSIDLKLSYFNTNTKQWSLIRGYVTCVFITSHRHKGAPVLPVEAPSPRLLTLV